MKTANQKLQKRVSQKQKDDERYEEYKRTRAKRKKRELVIRRSIVVVLVSAIFLFCIFNLNYLTPTKFKEHFTAVSANSGKGNGFPYKFDTQEVLSFNSFGENDYTVLTDDYLMILNSSAKPVLKFTHNMANPVAKVSPDRILLFDQGGTKAYIINQSGKVLTFTIDDDIICADISNSGKTVIATDSSKQKKTVSVYSFKGKKIFSWVNGSGYIIDTALSSDGNSLAVGLVDTLDAVETASVLSFNVSSGEQRGHREYKSSSLYDVSYLNNSQIAVLCNDKIGVLNSKCEVKGEKELPSDNNYQLYTDKAGHIINLYSPYNNGSCIIDVYNSNLKNIYKKECKEDVRWTYSDGSSIATLYNKTVELNMIGGKVTYSAKLDNDFNYLVCKKKTVHLCSSGLISKVKVKKQ